MSEVYIFAHLVPLAPKSRVPFALGLISTDVIDPDILDGVVNDDESGFIGRWFGGASEELDMRDFSVKLFQSNGVVNVMTQALGEFDDARELTEELLQVIDDNLS